MRAGRSPLPRRRHPPRRADVPSAGSSIGPSEAITRKRAAVPHSQSSPGAVHSKVTSPEPSSRVAVRSSGEPGRPSVVPVVSGGVLVVVEGPPLLVRASAGPLARVPEERPALAREGGDVQVAVAVGVADGRRRLQPAAGELGPARRPRPRRARRRGAGRGRCRPAPGAPGPPPATRAIDGLREELEVVGGARVPGHGGARCRVPRLLDVAEGQVLVRRRAGWRRR